MPGVREDVLPLPGGEISLVATEGDDAVVVHDGYGSRLLAHLAAPAAQELGLRLIAPDRPGFWGSAPRDASPLNEWPALLGEILDHLGIASATVLGASAGTPFAVAAAAAMPERIRHVVVVGPMAPLFDVDLAEMLPAQRRSFRMAQRMPGLGTASMLLMAKLARRRPELTAKLLTSQRPPVDATRMRTPEMTALLKPLVPELFGDGRAAREELRAVVSDWRPLLARVTQPVDVWAGTLDSVHPPALGHALVKAVRTGELHEVEGGFFDLCDRLVDVLDE